MDAFYAIRVNKAIEVPSIPVELDLLNGLALVNHNKYKLERVDNCDIIHPIKGKPFNCRFYYSEAELYAYGIVDIKTLNS